MQIYIMFITLGNHSSYIISHYETNGNILGTIKTIVFSIIVDNQWDYSIRCQS